MFSPLCSAATIIHIYTRIHRHSYIVIRNSWAKHGSASFHPILIFMTSGFFSSIPNPFNLFRFISFSFCPQQSRKLGETNDDFSHKSVFTGNVMRDVRRRVAVIVTLIDMLVEIQLRNITDGRNIFAVKFKASLYYLHLYKYVPIFAHLSTFFNL